MGTPLVTRVCVRAGCNGVFKCDKASTQIYCCRECGRIVHGSISDILRREGELLKKRAGAAS
jgi:hypothetical protein